MSATCKAKVTDKNGEPLYQVGGSKPIWPYGPYRSGSLEIEWTPGDEDRAVASVERMAAEAIRKITEARDAIRSAGDGGER